MLTVLALSLGLTLLFEVPVARLWGLRRRDLLLCVLVNVLTNPLAVLLHNLFPGWVVTALAEAAATAVEGGCYARFGDGVRRPFLLSLTANGVSFCLGLLVNHWIH